MRRAHLSSSLALLAVLIGGGCSFVTPAVRYFEVRPPSGAQRSGDPLPSVMVPDFSCFSAYDHLRVVVRKSPVEVTTSHSWQWTTVPGRMLAQGFRARLENAGRFESVRRDVTPRPPYIVEGLVQVIELNKAPAPTARLAIHLNVRRAADNRVIGEEFIDETQPAGGRDPSDGVMALRDLYSRVLDTLTDRIIATIEQDVALATTPRATGGGR